MTLSIAAIVGGALALLLIGFVLGSRLREGRDMMAPPMPGMGMKPPYVRSPAPASQSSPVQSLSPDTLSAVAAALGAGNKIEAIKIYRDATGADLKASKDAVEAMEA